MLGEQSLLHFDLSAVFELHGSQSMLGRLTYFHYPIGPMLLRKTWVQSVTGR